MNKILTKVFITGVLVGVFGVAIYFIGKDNDTPSHTGPEVIVRDFTEAMETGDFEKARSLCDTSAMQEYLDAYMQKWETKSLKDRAAFASTVRILGETTIEIDEIDMLESTASEVRPTSRLACQITVSDEMDGLIIHLPERQF